jgi:tetratricopeptide (TPR) repeat protein
MRQSKILFALLGLLALGLVGCNKLQARDNLNKGVRAFRESNYQTAVDYFKTALDLDPELLNAELYLGTAYSQQFIPGALSEENRLNAQLAVETFESVLDKDPNNSSAIAGLASIYQNTGDLDRAREYYVRQVGLSPDDPVAHYSVGSINWYIVTDRAPQLAGLDDLVDEEEDEGTTAEEAQAVRDELTALIEEGQQHLDRALALRDTYEDAMSYKNLLYRQAAELIPEDTEDEDALAQREQLIAQADDWFDRALATRARNAELAAAGLPVEQ